MRQEPFHLLFPFLTMTTGSTSRRASDASSIDNSDRGFDPPTEASPLLESTSPTITPASTAWNAFLLRHIVPVCMITIFCLEVGDLLQMAPVNRILEGIICRDFYPEHAGANPLSLTDDPRCKSTDVQSKLAMLRGWQSTLDFLPGLTPQLSSFSSFISTRDVLLSVYYNLSGDRH